MEKKLEVSVISPVFNERENLKTFVDSVTKVMHSTGMSWELIVVDDGSDDGSTTVIKELINQDNIKCLLLAKNYGQTTAIRLALITQLGSI